MTRKSSLFALSVLLCFATLANAQDSPPPPPAPPAANQDASAHPNRVRVGGIVQATKMIKQVTPVYPQIAKTAHIEGTVVLHAIIAKDGTMKELVFVSGPPLLMRAAMDAVRQWVYAPTLLNGEPVEVDTTISVVFTLGSSAQASEQEAENKEIDPQFKADILHMIEVSHLTDKMREVMQSASASQRTTLLQAFPNVPDREKIVDRFFEKLADVMTSPDAIDGIVRIYAKYLSDDEIKAATKFYETPAGQHCLEIMPKVMSEGVQWGEQLGAKSAPEILKQLCVEFPQLKGDARFCPGDSDKKSQFSKPPANGF